MNDYPNGVRDTRSGQARDTGGLREALETIREVCKPMSIDMSGRAIWFDGGTPAGGGSRERIWRICDAALSQGAAHEERGLDVGGLMHFMRYHASLRGKEGEYADGWDAATRTLLDRLATPEAAPEDPYSIAETPEDNR